MVLVGVIYNYFDWGLYYFTVNTSLFNGLLLIHPLCLYFFLIFLIFNFIFFFKKKIFFLNNLIFTTYQMDTLKLAVLIQFSIFLGGWWAQLELHWGGWWSWDLIEVISLNYFIIILYLIHNKKKFNNFTPFFLDFLFKILCFICILKFNYLDSVHNFVSSVFFFQNFFELTLSFFLVVFFLWNLKIFNSNFYIKFKSINLFYIFFILNLFFIILIIYEFIIVLFKEYSLLYFFHNNFIFVLIFYLFIFFNKIYYISPNLLLISFWELNFFYFILKFNNKFKLLYLHIFIFLTFYILNNNILLFTSFNYYPTDVFFNLTDNFACFNSKKYIILPNATGFEFIIEKFINNLNSFAVEYNLSQKYLIYYSNLFNIFFFWLIVYVFLLFYYYTVLVKVLI